MLATGRQSCYPLLSLQEEKPYVKVSAHLMTLVSKRIHEAGTHFCFVLHPHVDSQNTALTNNLANFQIKERMCCQSPRSDTVLVASEGLSPTLVSSAEHTPSKKLPYQPAASCVLYLVKITALTKTCCGGIPVLKGKALARDPKKRTVRGFARQHFVSVHQSF